MKQRMTKQNKIENEMVEHKSRPNRWFWNAFVPNANCVIISDDDFRTIEIDSVQVFQEEKRRQGIGASMIASIRERFPAAFIWVDTWDHSRPFWEKMVERGYVDIIANDYPWPCFDTNCKICHKDRKNGIRRGYNAE